MSDKLFLDTNVVVYAFDQHAPQKQAKAQMVLDHALRTGSAVLSAQVLSEFFVAVTRRIPRPMTCEEGLQVISRLGAFPVLEITYGLVRSAIRIHQQHRISYWDALILSAAEHAGCDRVLSEDLNPGQRYGTVLVENPFVAL